MKNYTLLVLILICFGSNLLFTQPEKVETTSQIVKENRYYDYKGNPYYFKDWVKAKLVGKGGNIVEDVLINFNGYTQNFEVKQPNGIKILNANKYYSIVIEKKGNESERAFRESNQLIFRNGFHEKFLNKFAQVIYEGETFKFLKEIETELSVSEKVSIGEINEISKFQTREQYYIMAEGKLLFPIKHKNNHVLRVLGNPEGEKILKLKTQMTDVEERRKFEQQIEKSGGYVINKGDLLYDEMIYYLGVKEDLLFPVELNKKHIFGVIGEDNLDVVKSYLKENGNKLSSEDEIAAFLKYYEENF